MKPAPRRILVAEDNAILLSVLQLNLEDAGYAVTVARNGREALEYLSRDTFDLLITDYQMPDVSGGDLLRAVRETLHNRELPIILCSGKGLELDFAHLRERWQLARVFFKPFSVREVLACMRQLLNPTVAPAAAPALASG
jgi:CheY-like chemotaxis protein